MAQAAHALITPDTWFRAATNDNDRGPPTEIDPWHMLISRYKAMNLPTLAVLTAQYKLKGCFTFEKYTRLLIYALEKSIADDEARA